MKTASELMQILEQEAVEFGESSEAQSRAGVAFRFKGNENGQVVWHGAHNTEGKLEAVLQSRGEPIGLILVTDAAVKVGNETIGKLNIASSRFEEYAADPTAAMDLTRICGFWARVYRDELAKCGDAKISVPGQKAWA